MSIYLKPLATRANTVRCVRLLSIAIGVCFALAGVADVVIAQSLEIAETEDTLTITQNDRVVLAYNKKSPPVPSGIDPIYARSGCLHPVSSPGGKVVTKMFPFDHPHQHGIFSAWVRTTYDGEAIDFWNLAGRTGRVVHERVASRFKAESAVGFEVDLLHRIVTEPMRDVLRERWKITAYPTDGTFHCFDLETTQSAITDIPLMISEYHYGGIVLRGPTRWLTAKDRGAREVPDLVREPSDFLNDLGSNRKDGNHEHAKWVVLTGKTDGKPATIAVLSHPTNFRAPQAARLHPTKPYFCFAPCVDGAFQIDREHPFQGRYRYLVTDAEPNPDWIDEQWKNWVED